MTNLRPKGFTLMEMVVTLTMLSILAAIAGPYLLNGVRAYNDSASAVHTVSKLRMASERLAREIRDIRRDGLGNYDITLPLSATSLQFFKLDGQQVSVNEAAPLVTLAYTGIGGTPTLTDEVSTLTFRYFRDDGVNFATSNADTAIIEFELVLIHAGNNYPQRTRVALRN